MTRGQVVYEEVAAKLRRDGLPLARVHFYWPAGTASAEGGGYEECVPRDVKMLRFELEFNGAVVTKVEIV